MVFSSAIFLLYFLPVFLFIYYLSDNKFKNYVILFFSVIFYAWGAPKFIFVLLGVTFLDFHFVKWMDKALHPFYRIIWLMASLTMNVGLLFYFKYCNFFIDNINYLLIKSGLQPLDMLDVVMPIGISFYTFETITYVVDVYRKIHKPLNNFLDYQLYIILFPKLIAGPIVKFHDIADQIYGRFEYLNSGFALQGFYRFCLGLGKKVIIANNVGVIADSVFNGNLIEFSSRDIWIGALSYTLQIYFDFSGYSDMAIGLCKMMGFKIPENFDNPYTSRSITEFWKRWHISLGNWMREYLYIPLGGNRVSKFRTYVNLWIVFIISGFWHGASWNFILWGIYHGFFMVMERWFLMKVYERLKWVSVFVNFLIVVIGWVMFRNENFSNIKIAIKKMFYLADGLSNQIVLDNEQKFYLILGLVTSFSTIFPFVKKLEVKIYYEEYNTSRYIVMWVISIIIFLISLSYITAFHFNPFIYFRF